MGTNENPLSRIQAARARLNKPVVCPRCGSLWFQEVTFHKYSSTAYASAELEPKENMPQTIRVCLCGWPCKPSAQVRAGRTPNDDIKSFLESVELAVKRAYEGPQATELQKQIAKLKEELRQALEHVATRTDVQTLRIEVAGLRDQIERLKGATF